MWVSCVSRLTQRRSILVGRVSMSLTRAWSSWSSSKQGNSESANWQIVSILIGRWHLGIFYAINIYKFSQGRSAYERKPSAHTGVDRIFLDNSGGLKIGLWLQVVHTYPSVFSTSYPRLMLCYFDFSICNLLFV